MPKKRKQKEKTSKVMEHAVNLMLQASEHVRLIQNAFVNVHEQLNQVYSACSIWAKAMNQVHEQLREAALVISIPTNMLVMVSNSIREMYERLQSVKIESLSPSILESEIIQPCDRTYQSLLNYVAFLEREVVKERREKEQLKQIIRRLEDGRKKLTEKYIT